MSAQTEIDNSSISELSLKDFVFKIKDWKKFLYRRWRLILIWSLLLSALGLVLSFIIRPKYKAVTTFILEESKKSGLGDYASIASKLGFSAGSGGGEECFKTTITL